MGQFKIKGYNNNEIKEIIRLYNIGTSFTKIGKIFNRQKNSIKKILIDNNVWVENRDEIKKIFTDEEINRIVKLYNDGLNCDKIGKIFNVSKTPINRILKKLGILKKPKSNGVKIILDDTQISKIKELYLIKYKNVSEIAKEMGLKSSFIDKFLNNSGYRRTKSEGSSIGGVKKYNNNIDYNQYLEKLPDYIIYKREVRKITNKQLINTLPNYEKRGVSGVEGAYHLDHKFSILEGYKQGIEPEIIGNINNLEFIPWEDNLTKRTKCSIIITDLLKI